MSRLDKPVKVGIVGSGYVAKRRVEALQKDDRAKVIAIAGTLSENLGLLCDSCGARAFSHWQDLIALGEIDLVIIATINSEHGKIARAAIEADKQVICEYPLALDPVEAFEIIELARSRQKFLHVEHIEILGGLHRTMQEFVPQIGEISYGRYVTITPKRPAPHNWTHHRDRFGFPFCAALSRIHRFTNLFGAVESVTGQARFWHDGEEKDYYSACLCTAQLRFVSGLVVDLIYGKGDRFCQSMRTLELHGEGGTLNFVGEKGQLIRGEESQAIEVETRRGLFDRDTVLVLDALFENKPLYISPRDSYYALLVADAVRQSAATGQTVAIRNSQFAIRN